MTYPIALLVALALGVANFAYQAFSGQDWALALERTWFQAWACIAVAAADHRIRRILGAE